MTPDDLDRILASDAILQPSPAFSRKVMAAVRHEASTPALSFPWVRFGIGIGASSLMAAAATALFTGSAPSAPAVMDVMAPVAALAPELACAVAAVIIGIGIAAVPRVLARP
jgi:hypothetical protein